MSFRLFAVGLILPFFVFSCNRRPESICVKMLGISSLKDNHVSFINKSKSGLVFKVRNYPGFTEELKSTRKFEQKSRINIHLNGNIMKPPYSISLPDSRFNYLVAFEESKGSDILVFIIRM